MGTGIDILNKTVVSIISRAFLARTIIIISMITAIKINITVLRTDKSNPTSSLGINRQHHKKPLQ
jgi:hypothetical protein